MNPMGMTKSCTQRTKSNRPIKDPAERIDALCVGGGFPVAFLGNPQPNARARRARVRRAERVWTTAFDGLADLVGVQSMSPWGRFGAFPEPSANGRCLREAELLGPHRVPSRSDLGMEDRQLIVVGLGVRAQGLGSGRPISSPMHWIALTRGQDRACARPPIGCYRTLHALFASVGHAGLAIADVDVPVGDDRQALGTRGVGRQGGG